MIFFSRRHDVLDACNSLSDNAGKRAESGVQHADVRVVDLPVIHPESVFSVEIILPWVCKRTKFTEQ